MKRTLVVAGLFAVVLSGCSMFRDRMVADPTARARPGPAQLFDPNGVPIEPVPFVAGVSSVTVERLASAQSCRGGEGAALVTPVGPVEVYRMRCEDGRTFMARCELRQCKQM
ncbi:hypothetical protein [Massilia sp. S19_KUP03_FR1]|uniref:hypothetical protein n=1 Tax=Massilia sp. S19_KUP03_FR1 TaxID=3025503 RepID=UPI002FCD4E1A